MGKADNKAFDAMNAASKDLIIEEDKPKKTVVILAEAPSGRVYDESSGKWSKEPKRQTEFSDQAHWWRRNHPEFNVIVKPFYKDWEGHTLGDAVSDIKKIEGNVSISFMGHSGSTLGGHLISRQEKAMVKHNKAWDIKHVSNLQQRNMSTEKDLRTVINRPIPKTISEHITDLGDKVDEVIVGACTMGSTCSTSMQSLSSETGKNVYAQLEGSWGTGSIRETGEEPYEKFFVGGKIPAVGGVVFKPNANPSFIDEKRGKRFRSSPSLSVFSNPEDPDFDFWSDKELRKTLSGDDDVDYQRRIPLPGNYARKKSSELSKYEKKADKWLASETSKAKERLEDIPYRESDEYLTLYNLFSQSYE